MKKAFTSGLFFIVASLIWDGVLFGQCKPVIKVNGIETVVNSADPYGVTFPFWLNEGQTLAIGSSVISISAIEFSVVGSSLEFSQVLFITSTSGVSVPTGKVWKVEAVLKENNTSQYTSAKFTTPGSYTFKVPGCASQICIEAWGGGGAGGGCPNPGSGNVGAGGGGGGAYSAQCFAVTPGTEYTVVVGSGGKGTNTTAGPAGEASSVGSLITASGGNGGAFGTTSGGAGGTGGTSIATSNAPGQDGKSGANTFGGAGGAGGNGGAGGAQVSGSSSAGSAGTAPGGGGSGAWNSGNSSARVGGNGGNGQVIITW